MVVVVAATNAILRKRTYARRTRVEGFRESVFESAQTTVTSPTRPSALPSPGSLTASLSIRRKRTAVSYVVDNRTRTVAL